MDTGRISARYAKAVYEFALEKGEEERVYGEMKTLTASFREFKNLKIALENPTVPMSKKMEVLRTAAGIHVSETFESLLKLLAANRRETYINTVALMYGKYYRKQKGMLIAHLTTSGSAPEELKKVMVGVLSHIEHKRIDFVIKEDPELIGGFMLTLEDYQLDASVKTQLNRIRTQLAK